MTVRVSTVNEYDKAIKTDYKLNKVRECTKVSL